MATDYEYELDFTDVETSSKYLAPGIYQARLMEVEEKPGRVAPLYVWRFTDIASGGQSEVSTSLAPQALWKLKEVLEALGVKADGPMRVSLRRLQKLMGRVATITVEAEVADNGKTYSRITHLAKGAPEEEEPWPDEPAGAGDGDGIPF
jgi:hypothetical protein